MATFEEAKAAKDALRQRLGRTTWLKGIGVGVDSESQYCVKVNVAAPEDAQNLPRSSRGVKVVWEVVGEIRAQKGS